MEKRMNVARITRNRCEGLGLSEREIEEVIALAGALYETAAEHGIDRAAADAVTSFVSAAIDGIRLVGRSRSLFEEGALQ
jgi:hypothetical protein